jgi:hypothetical protein
MSDLPQPGIQRHTWRFAGKSAYLAPNQIHGGAAGRISRHLYTWEGIPVIRHPEHGLPAEKNYYLAEAKLENDTTFVDLWQIISIDRLDPSHATVTLKFAARQINGNFDPIPRTSTIAQKYRQICRDVLERAQRK